jgi:hypothetical protein
MSDILFRLAGVCRFKGRRAKSGWLNDWSISLWRHVVATVSQKEIVRYCGCIDEAAPETAATRVSEDLCPKQKNSF